MYIETEDVIGEINRRINSNHHIAGDLRVTDQTIIGDCLFLTLENGQSLEIKVRVFD